MDVNLALRRQQVEGCELEIVERFDGPAILPVGCHKPLDASVAGEKLSLDGLCVLQRLASQSSSYLTEHGHGLGQRSIPGCPNRGVLTTKQLLSLSRPRHQF